MLIRTSPAVGCVAECNNEQTAPHRFDKTRTGRIDLHVSGAVQAGIDAPGHSIVVVSVDFDPLKRGGRWYRFGSVCGNIRPFHVQPGFRAIRRRTTVKMPLPALSSALLALSAATMPALAHEQVYTALLSGAAENPANASLGGGAGVVTFDLDLLTMRVQATFAGLTGNVTASHIHCCAAPPTNAGVATQTPTFTGFPLGATFGSYDHTFDMTLASSYNAAFVTANGGAVSTAFSALLAGLDAGKAYLNIHSTFAPGGEIRGNLVAVVPEPETYALFLGGLAIVGWVVRRRERVA